MISLDAMGELPHVADKIQQQSNKFAMSVENEGTGDSKLNDSPDRYWSVLILFVYTHSIGLLDSKKKENW